MAGAALWVMDSSMGADVMDFDELGCHKRREGAFSVSNATGFDASKAQQAPETTRSPRAGDLRA